MSKKLPSTSPGRACEAPSWKYPDGCKGTKSGYARHLRVGEPPCDECKTATYEENRERGKRKRREQGIMPHPDLRSMPPGRACEAPSAKYPDGRKGSDAGYQRHRAVGEPPCEECLAAAREYNRKRLTRKRRAKGIGPKPNTRGMTWGHACEAEPSAKGTSAGASRHRRKGEPVCKECKQAETDKMMAWFHANPDKYEVSKAQAQERRSNWTEERRAEEAERYRKWSDANPDIKRAIHKRYRDKHPERVQESYRRKSIKRRGAGALTTTGDAYVARLSVIARDGADCFYCGERPGEHLDHVRALARGGKDILENLRWVCADCNQRKHAIDLDVWVARRLADGKPVTERAKALAKSLRK